MVVPDAFPDLQKLPEAVLNRLRAEFAVNGISMEGPSGISLFPYDNDTFAVYSYVTSRASDAEILLRVKGAKELQMLNPPAFFNRALALAPLYTEKDGTAVFRVRASVGRFSGFKIVR